VCQPPCGLPGPNLTSKLACTLSGYNSNRQKDSKALYARLRKFTLQEGVKVPLGILVGATLAGLKHLLFNDGVFAKVISQTWQKSPVRTSFGGLVHYQVELYAVGAALSVLFLIFCSRPINRVLKSWLQGVVSGLSMIWAIPFSFFLSFEELSPSERLVGAVTVSTLLSILSVRFYLDALSRRSEKYLLPPPAPEVKPDPGVRLDQVDADSPIESEADDLLNRAALVDSLAKTIMESQAPVIALEGDYGDGKSSVLNLLRKRLADHAIVITFKTWLPRAEDSLVRDLFSDISAECRKLYYVPELRSHLLTYARIIGGSISALKALTDVLPAISQREEIAEVSDSLARVPRRIVVLLDDMDRLHADELRALLKVIRGATSFPNLSYVCAFSRAAINKIHGAEDLETLGDYYEKFFPISHLLPKPEPALLKKVLDAGLARVFDSPDWFETANDKTKYQKQLDELWDDVLCRILTNLRKVKLVINNVAVAARPVCREVNAFDLTAIETLRRFFPEVYEQVRSHGDSFIGTDTVWRSRAYSSDQVKAIRKQFLDGLIKKLCSEEHSKPAADLLWWLFPVFGKQYSESVGRSRIGIKRDEALDEHERRISHEDFFPIYFLYQGPESHYTETELRAFIQEMNGCRSMGDRKALFTRVLITLPKGDSRRLSFLHRLVGSIDRLNEEAAKDLASAVASSASDYEYDFLLPSAAEAGRAMAIVFTVCQRFSQSERIQEVLEDAINAATDDTLALRLLTFSVNPERNKIIKDFSHVRPDDLKRIFVNRMRRRYVEGFNKVEPSLAQADREAFVIWAGFTEEERQAEIGFWRKYVGTSRKRLARMCDIIFPGGAIWETDPRPHVERLFPLDELKKLDDELPADDALDKSENGALSRIRKLLAGEFSHGVGFAELEKLNR
jgi:predicted KAP-like P-loop ATPase